MATKRKRVHNKANQQPISATRVVVWVLTSILAVLILFIGSIGIFAYNRLDSMQITTDEIQNMIDEAIQQDEELTVDETEDPEVLEGLEEIKEDDLENTTIDVVEAVTSVKNYMLFGVDSRNVDQFSGLSDVMIMVTVDTKTNAIKLTSFARDILLRVEGYGQNRLNIVYKYKGPEEACKAIEGLCGIPIDGYGIMNFYTVAEVIDIMGGVDIENLTAAEHNSMNSSITEMNRYTDKPTQLVRDTGEVHLDGLQAVAYMRIRKVGGDTQRTERQRTVISTLFKGIKNMDIADMLTLVDQITPYVKTDLTKAEILSLAKDVFTLRGCEIEQMRMPVEGAYYYAMHNNMSIIKIDTEENAAAVQKFIYGE